MRNEVEALRIMNLLFALALGTGVLSVALAQTAGAYFVTARASREPIFEHWTYKTINYPVVLHMLQLKL